MRWLHINISFVAKVELQEIILGNAEESGLNYIIMKFIFSVEWRLIINRPLKCVQSIKIGLCPRALSTLNALEFEGCIQEHGTAYPCLQILSQSCVLPGDLHTLSHLYRLLYTMHTLPWYHNATHHFTYKEAAEDSFVCAHHVLQSARSTLTQNTEMGSQEKDLQAQSCCSWPRPH